MSAFNNNSVLVEDGNNNSSNDNKSKKSSNNNVSLRRFVTRDRAFSDCLPEIKYNRPPIKPSLLPTIPAACDNTNFMLRANQKSRQPRQNQKISSQMDDDFVNIEISNNDTIFLDDNDTTLLDDNENELNFSLLHPTLLKARIITPLPDTYSACLGDQAVFTCLTTVLFPADVDWTLNGRPIKPTIDGRVYFNNNRRQLVILYVTSEDQGVLKVTAKNKFGSENSECEVSIVPAIDHRNNTKRRSKSTLN